MSSITNLVYKLPDDLRLRILGNQEIFEKSHIWLEIKNSAQSFLQKLKFDSSI